jgi:GT2 family glycosyltransferase
MKIMPLVLQSLESIASIDYPGDRFELIVVDNGSTDGSFERIREFVEKRSGLRKKVIRLGKNLGFTGGNNVGFMARDRESKYVLLLNNDAVLLGHGLKTLAEYAESFERLGGLQGVVLKYGTRFIDTAGDFINELLQVHVFGGYREYPWVLRKPIYVTYADGSVALYRVESVLKCVGEKLFIDEFFAYGDDNVLGLMLWNCGFPLVSVPEVVAHHVRSFTFKKQAVFSTYLNVRNRVALSVITNIRYKYLVLLHVLKSISALIARTRSKNFAKAMIRALIDGLRLGKTLKRKRVMIDIYKAPIIIIPPKDVPLFFTVQRVAVKYCEKYIINKISELAVE